MYIRHSRNQAVNADCGGNSDLNVESILKLVSDAAALHPTTITMLLMKEKARGISI